MSSKNTKIASYEFQDEWMFEEARKEYEAIQYIKEKTNLKDPGKALKLYKKMNEKPSFHTVIGFDFMQELRNTITQSGLYAEENLAKVKIARDLSKYSHRYNQDEAIPDGDNMNLKSTNTKKLRQEFEKLKVSLRNTRIVVVFLAIIIIAFLYIAKNSDYGMMSDYETSILNKYANWEEQLKEREAAVTAKEKELDMETNK